MGSHHTDPSAFSFDVKALNIEAKSDVIVQIPPGLSDKNALFEMLRREVPFPDYFGNNWNALFDCLCDLSWIKSRRVIILHSDLPPLDRKELATYLHVLSDSVRGWKPNEDHELVVAFPPIARDAIVEIAKSSLS